MSGTLMTNEVVFFGGFLFLVLLVLVMDLGIFSKKNHIVKFAEAIAWTIVWVSCALGFYILLDTHGELVHSITNAEQLKTYIEKYNHPVAITGNYELDLVRYRDNLSLEFITGYLIEYALSIDNIFVIIVIFSAFSVKEKYYKRILFWGVLGAIVMRFLFIFLGATMIERFDWIIYVFGAILIFTGVKLFVNRDKEDTIDPADHPVSKMLGKVFNVFPRFVGSAFFLKFRGKRYVTPLFIALMVVEFTDVIFAFDSVPAIFSVTKDPYIVFFSNIFAIMGLRSLFFLLTNIMHLFHYLKYGLSVLLLFIGVKMMVHDWLHGHGFTTLHSLMVIIGILLISIVASLIFPKKPQQLVEEREFR